MSSAVGTPEPSPEGLGLRCLESPSAVGATHASAVHRCCPWSPPPAFCLDPFIQHAKSSLLLRDCGVLFMKMARRVTSCLLGLFLAGCHSPAITNPAPPADAFDPRPVILKAMDSATSYRRSMPDDSDVPRNGTTAHMHNEFAVEVSCPGRSHYRQTFTGQVRYDEYFIEGSWATLGLSQWKWDHGNGKVAPGCPGDVSGNNFGPGGVNDVVRARDYLNLVRFTPELTPLRFTKGATDTVEYAPCQIWETTFTGNYNRPYNAQFCIGTADNLPRRLLVTSPGERLEIRYWDWNSTVSVVPPD
jgi:hypothetical protein